MTDDEMDDLIEEIQDASGGCDYKKLTKTMFTKMDTQAEERSKYQAKMAEIKEYFAKNAAAA